MYWGGDIQIDVTRPRERRAGREHPRRPRRGRHQDRDRDRSRHLAHAQPRRGRRRCLVAAAHARGRIVTAHVSDPTEAREALDGGVDELAHSPCGAPAPELMRELAERDVPMVGTMDVEKNCPFKIANVRSFVQAGGRLLYGTDFSLVPPGIDVRELKLMAQAGLTFDAGARGGHRRGREGARREPRDGSSRRLPADVVVVRGDPRKSLSVLGQPLLVLAGGERVVGLVPASSGSGRSRRTTCMNRNLNTGVRPRLSQNRAVMRKLSRRAIGLLRV